MKVVATIVAGLLGAVTVAFAANGEEISRQNFKVIGLGSATPPSIFDEVPFWRETLPTASKGKLTAEITPFDLMAIDDQAMLRLLKLGVADFVGMDITKMAGDDARFEACDLAGLTTDRETAHKACTAYRSVLDERMQKNWNAKLLAIGANTPQVFWCRENVKSVADLAGKKIRTFNNTMKDFLGGINSTPIRITFPEVVPALNNGVIDCAVTGTLSGNTGGWYEVSKSVYILPIGWSINGLAVNKTRWEKLDAPTRNFLTKQFAAYEDKLWDTLAKSEEQAKICNSGQGKCTMGKSVSINVNFPSEADLRATREIVAKAVLPGWAKRCGESCVAEWNNLVGKVVGQTVSVVK